jgi:hypothetical protein
VTRPGPAPPRRAVALATLLAWALRVAGLGHKPLWIDEAHTLYFASQPPRAILLRLCDPHPPGYYLFLKPFLHLGASEFALRLPSAIVATLAVPLLFIAALRLGSVLRLARPARVAALSAFLLAAAPLHVWYSREARMYALVTTLGLVTVVLALRFARRPAVATGTAYALAAAAALLVDQTAALPLLLGNFLWGWCWVRRAPSRPFRALARWLALQAVAAAPFLVWTTQALYPAISGAGRLYQLAMLARVLERLGLPAAWVVARRVLLAAAVAAAALVTILYVAAVRRRRPLGRGWVVAAAMLFVLTTVASAIPRLFTVKRLLMGLLPAVVLAGAWALDRLCPGDGRGSPGAAMSAALSIVLCAALSAVNVLFVPRGAPWPDVAAWVEDRAAPDDAIWVDALAVPAFDAYFDGPQGITVLHADSLEALELGGGDGERRIWLVAVVDPYRDLTDYLSPDVASARVAHARWPRATVIAYRPSRLDRSIAIVDRQPPSWFRTWPSPLDPACSPEG